jgi:hypothetical protein
MADIHLHDRPPLQLIPGRIPAETNVEGQFLCGSFGHRHIIIGQLEHSQAVECSIGACLVATRKRDRDIPGRDRVECDSVFIMHITPTKTRHPFNLGTLSQQPGNKIPVSRRAVCGWRIQFFRMSAACGDDHLYVSVYTDIISSV